MARLMAGLRPDMNPLAPHLIKRITTTPIAADGRRLDPRPCRARDWPGPPAPACSPHRPAPRPRPAPSRLPALFFATAAAPVWSVNVTGSALGAFGVAPSRTARSV